MKQPQILIEEQSERERERMMSMAGGMSPMVRPSAYPQPPTLSFKPSKSNHATFSFSNLSKPPNFCRHVAHVSLEDMEDLVAHVSHQKQKLKVVVKPMEKPRIVLKFIWMEKNIGVSLDQVIPGHGTIPLSPYYFWPRKDAWEELKLLLESKPWISHKQIIILLNQATDIINLWQQTDLAP